MKAISAQCASSGVSGGRVSRPGRRDVENEEIQMYLSKLKELVPFMPKNRKLSKLEVIQYVIDYICDLQDALESTPGVVQGAAAAAAVMTAGTVRSLGSPIQRQPLGVLAPNANTILSPTCSTQEASASAIIITKGPSPTETRPVSV